MAGLQQWVRLMVLGCVAVLSAGRLEATGNQWVTVTAVKANPSYFGDVGRIVIPESSARDFHITTRDAQNGFMATVTEG